MELQKANGENGNALFVLLAVWMLMQKYFLQRFIVHCMCTHFQLIVRAHMWPPMSRYTHTLAANNLTDVAAMLQNLLTSNVRIRAPVLAKAR
eukprot:4876670-Amphidinium_carterae.1